MGSGFSGTHDPRAGVGLTVPLSPFGAIGRLPLRQRRIRNEVVPDNAVKVRLFQISPSEQIPDCLFRPNALPARPSR